MNYTALGKPKRKKSGSYIHYTKTKEILALTMGKQNKKIIMRIYKLLKSIQINFWVTNHWETFKTIFTSEKHKVRKEFTKVIEGVNTYLRSTCKTFGRRTTAFSTKVVNHWATIKLVIKHRNLRLYTLDILPKNLLYIIET